MSYSAPITTTELNAVKTTANCYYAYITNIIRKFRERGVPCNSDIEFRNQLDSIIYALGFWQQSENGSTELYDNPYTQAELNGMVGWVRVNCGTGCIVVPEDPQNTYITVLDFLTDYGDYITP